MASDFAMVFGRTGRTFVVPASNAVTMGEQPRAWAPDIFVCTLSMSQRRAISCRPFQIFTYSEPDAIGATTCSGARQPSCSATSYASVLLPSA